MFLLKIQWELLGLKAPAFSWVVSACLILYSIYVYMGHVRASRNRQWVLALAEKRLASIRGKATTTPGEGITRSLYDSIAAVFSDLPLLLPSWRAIASSLVITDRDREGRLWVSEDVDQIMASANLTDRRDYRTAPNVISAVGLLATFLAILVALLDVRLTQNRVQGLDLLVQGLSGKFLSSVVALACATLLIQAEKGLYRPVLSGITQLSTALKSVLPRLIPAQIMSDLRTEMAQQARAFGAFDGDLKGAVKEGLGESVRSAVESLQKMASLQDELNRFVRENEAQKQEVMTEQLKVALQDFGKSLEASLERMASSFDEALALNTHGQFVEISASLSSVSSVLTEVNENLARNQYVLVDLVELARATTVTETAARQAQSEQMANTVTDLMTRLQEKTTESVTSLDTTLAAVTLNISEKVMELSNQMASVIKETSENSTNRVLEVSTQMASVIKETSERSTNKAREVMEQAGSLSTQTAIRLAELLESHGSELTRVEELRDMLDTTIKGFVASLEKYGDLTDGLQKVTAQVNVGAASMSQAAKSIREGQDSAARISASLSEQIESMRGAVQGQSEVWERIRESMVEYERLFGTVESQASEMLGQIARHLATYSDATEKHFSNLAQAADTLVSQATGRLSGSIEELSEQLDDLHVVLGGRGRLTQTRS